MLELLSLRNFKAFLKQEILLRPLTLFTGLNGMGKSSALQSLLLLRQSYQQRVLGLSESAGLVLNGELVQLGTGRDVLFEHAEEDEISLTLISEGNEARWRFAYDRQADVLRNVSEGEVHSSIYLSNLFTDNFHYLEAERVGPRTSFEMADFAVREHRQIGTRGQYAVHFLDQYSGQGVLEELFHPSGRSSSLIDQVNAWMGDVSPGTTIRARPYGEMDLMHLSFGFERADTSGDIRFYRSTNVGFGLTYTLPVLVALLSSPSGALVLLENPEAHLHPRGQSQAGELIARAASAGIQVLVETHSDHILNGIRVAVKRGLASQEDIALHYFQLPSNYNDMSGIEVISPQIDRDGRLDMWPEGFFDEYGKSLRNLL